MGALGRIPRKFKYMARDKIMRRTPSMVSTLTTFFKLKPNFIKSLFCGFIQVPIKLWLKMKENESIGIISDSD